MAAATEHAGRRSQQSDVPMAKAVRSPRRCRASCSKPAASPPTSSTACTAGAAPAPARVSGNTAASSPASRRRTSTGGARRATTISMSASRNGRPRTPCGCGRTARRRWRSPRRQARDSKLERALIVAFALAELLVAGGERVGIPGLMNPTASRNVIDKMAQAMLHDDATRPSLPPSFVPSALAEIVVLSDFWSPIAGDQDHAGGLSASGAHGTLVQIVDPAEETFPYSGRVEFVEPEGGERHHRRPRRKLGERLCRARRAASRPNPRRDQQARLAVLDPHHRPLGGRAAAVPARRHDGEQGRRAHRPSKRGAAA